MTSGTRSESLYPLPATARRQFCVASIGAPGRTSTTNSSTPDATVSPSPAAANDPVPSRTLIQIERLTSVAVTAGVALPQFRSTSVRPAVSAGSSFLLAVRPVSETLNDL